MSTPAVSQPTHPRKRRKRFNLHIFLITIELAAFHIAATIIVLVWLYRHVMHEIER